MKNIKIIMAVPLVFILILCSPLSARARDYSRTKYDQTRWDKIKEDYLDTKTDRLIFVKYEGGTNASVEMWKKYP